MTARTKRLKRKSSVRRKRDPIPWKYCFLTLVCGLLLVAGFFYAARQHFSSMSYGMENAKLRKEIDKLKSSERLYKLKKEIALSPAEIKKAAKKLGLQTMTANNIEVAKSTKTKVKQTVKKEDVPKVSKESASKTVKTEKKDKNKNKNKTKPQKSKDKKKKDKKADRKSKNSK